jgi:hypothetical protein
VARSDEPARRRAGALCALSGACALALATGTAAPAQQQVSPRELMTAAAGALEAGDIGSAAVMADALIARDGADVPALILRAETAIMAGDLDSGLNAARRAWAAAEVEPARYAAARLAALALSQQEAYTRSQFWLRRARQHAPGAAEAQQVAQDYAHVRRRNPLSFQLEVNVAPSDNINNGTANETLTIEGLPFTFSLTGDSQPLSGTEFTVGGNLRYKLRDGARSLTYAEVTGFGRTYRLSSEARDLVPDAEGSDYAEAQLTFGLGHFWLPAGGRDPWQIDIARGRFWYGGEPYLDFLRTSVNRPVTLSGTDRLRFGATWERLEETRGAESEALSLRAGWEHVFEGAGVFSLGVRGRTVEAEGLDKAYQARAATLGWQFENTGISVAYDIEERSYERSLYVFDTRTDTRHSLRLSVPVPQVEVYGFRPVINAERVVTDSNVNRFETETTGLGLTFRSAF